MLLSENSVILDYLPVGVYKTDSEGNIIYANKVLLTILGLDETSEIFSSQAMEFFSNPEQRMILFEGLKSNTENQKEFELVRKDGKRIWVKDTFRKYSLDGKDYYEGILEDITHLKSQYNKLSQELEKQFLYTSILFDKSNDVIFIYDLNSKSTEINPYGLEIAGYSNDDINNYSLFELVSPDQYELLLLLLEEFNSDRVKDSITELKIKKKNGGYIWVEFKFSLMHRGNKPVAVFGIGRDITDRKLAEHKITESEKQYRELLELIPDPVIIYNKGLIVYANLATYKVTEMTESELIGKSILAHVPDEFKSKIADYMSRRLSGEELDEYELKLEFNNKELWARVNASVVHFNNERSILAILNDITEVRKKEIQLNENSRFLSDIINSLDSAIMVADKNHQIIDYNNNAKDFLEFINIKFDHIKSNHFLDDLFSAICNKSKDDINELKAQFNAVISSKINNFRKEYQIKNNGSAKWFKTSFIALSGSQKGVLIKNEDISKSKNDTIEIEDAKARLRTILDNSVQSFILADTKRKVLAFNKPAEISTKKTLDKILDIGELIDNYIYPKDLDNFLWNYNLCLEGQTISNERLTTDDLGNAKWLQYYYIPVFVEDEVISVVFNTIDITEKRKSEIKMIEYQRKLESQNLELSKLNAAIEQTVNSIIITDKNGEIEYINTSALELTGNRGRDLIARGINEISYFDYNDAELLEIFEYVGKGNIWKGELSRKNINGRDIHEFTTITPIYNAEGTLTNFIIIGEDVSDEIQIQREVTDKEEKLGAFVNALPDLMFVCDSMGVIHELFVPDYDEYKLFNTLQTGMNINADDCALKAVYDNIKSNCNIRNQMTKFDFEISNYDLTEYFESRTVSYGENKYVVIIRNISQSKIDELQILNQNKVKEVLTRWAGEFINVAPEEVEVTINNAIKDIGKALDVDRVYIFDYNFNLGIATNTYEWCNDGISAEIDNLREVPIEEMLEWPQEHSKGRIVHVENVISLPADNSVRKWLEPQGIKTLISIPIMQEKSCMGFVGFDSCRYYKNWSHEDQLVLKFLAELLSNLFDRISKVTENKMMESALVKHIRMKEILSIWANRFINLPIEETKATIDQLLSEVGNLVLADRVYIFEYDFDKLVAYNTHEWCNGDIMPAIDKYPAVPFQYMLSWVDEHKVGKSIRFDDVSKIDDSDPLKQILLSQNTASALSAPIYGKSMCLGFVGFDSVENTRVWSDDEYVVLRFLADLIFNLRDRINTEKELISAKTKAEESDKLKSAFIANMSHEIRTPMNGIIGFSKLLMSNDLSDDDKVEYSRIIRASSNRLIDLVNNILDISKIESGQMEIVNSVVDVNKLIMEIFYLYEYAAIDKGIELITELPKSDESFNIVTDHTKLNSIIVNIVDNAIKFTEKGKVTFGFFVDEENLTIFVKDTGIGVSESYLPFLFERFRQEDVGLSRAHEGAGLGLAISKGMAELINAEITVETQKGVGSSFIVTMPLNKTNLKNVTKMSQELVMIMDWKESVILIAEDDEVNYKYIEKLLTRIKGITTIRARNGKEVVEIALNQPEVSLVLMDVKMPVMDGYAATRQIKENRPELPVIAVTAFAMLHDKINAQNAGCDDYISKPYEADDILRIIDKFLKK